MAEALSTQYSGCSNYTFAVKPESLSQELAEMSAQLAATFPAGCVEPTQTNGSPTLYLFAMYEGKLTARLSIWAEPELLLAPTASQLNLPSFDTEVKLGFIGHYAATSLGAGLELLELADWELKRRGVNTVIGPVDGSTWKRYRLMTQSTGERSFPLEPVNPLSWNAHFQRSGFKVVKTYGTSINRDLEIKDPECQLLSTKLANQSVKLRSLNVHNLLWDLDGIYQVTMEAMKNNFLFSPADKALFLKEQMKLTTLADPELVVVAEQRGKIVGYLFSYPDTDRLIMKTIARDSDSNLKGLGRMLYQEVHSRAYEKGFREAVHALYATGNTASDISTMYGQSIRSYAVYGKAL